MNQILQDWGNVPPDLRRHVRQCDRCAALILWTETKAGKRLPVDAAPDDDGNTAVYRDGDGVWRSRRPTDDLPIRSYERLHMPHQATCSRGPDAVRRAVRAGVADGSVVEFGPAARARREAT